MKGKRRIGLISLIGIIVLILIGGGTTIFFLTPKTPNNEDKFQEANNIDLNENEVETPKPEVPDEYIGIYTANDFLKFNTEEYSLDGKYILMNNIDFSTLQEFIPIGYCQGSLEPKAFTGILDGNYYTISNLNLKTSKELQGDIGFFAEINAGIVKNLNIQNAQIIIDEVYPSLVNIGTLAGQINNSLIEKCNFNNIKFEINGTEKLGPIGTIAGSLDGRVDIFAPERYEGYKEKDENSNLEVTVVKDINVNVVLIGNYISESTDLTESSKFGGAFGNIRSSEGHKLTIKLENIIVNLNSNNEYISVAGFAHSANDAEIEKCGTNVEMDSKKAEYNSGFITSVYGCTIEQCYAKGNIIAKENISGFAYFSSYSSKITNSYSNVNITVTSDTKRPEVCNFIYCGEMLENIYASGTINQIEGKEINKAFVYDITGTTKNAYHNINEINDIFGGLGLDSFKKEHPNVLIGLTPEEMKSKLSYTSFDFENIWAIDEGTPYLKFEKNNK